MTRLNQLLKSYTNGTINESDYPEFIDLLIEQGRMVNYYGEQLKLARAEIAKSTKVKRVN